ncbi:MAG TPA: ATP-binding protein [Leptospiraceae bacterium]|nr:ATP-binding protein [Leptospiraceae bacterium]
MKLLKFNYNQFKGTDQEWVLKDCSFDKFNLVVGKNSAGKSKTLNVIFNLAQGIAGRRNSQHESEYEFLFENDGNEIVYSVVKSSKAVESEIFKVNGRKLLTRNADGAGKIWAEKINQELDFQIPVFLSAVNAKRDKLQHSFLEPLIQWAEEVSIFRFGTDLGKNKLFIKSKDADQKFNDGEYSSEEEFPLKYFFIGKKEFNSNFIQAIVNDMRAIGFPLEDIDYGSPIYLRIDQPLGGEPVSIIFKEEKVNYKFDQYDVSQGMFRAFSLLSYTYYMRLKDTKSTLLIDDIGEGLDYERSKNLIKKIEEICRDANFQVIMTSNDRYVMNAVDIKNWSIAVRGGQEIRFVNYQNSKGQFDDFTQLGLSNFDFFSGNFFEK